MFSLREIFKWIYGIWPQASKQASKHTHTRAQFSPASVGLAQARPANKAVIFLRGRWSCTLVSGDTNMQDQDKTII